MQDAGNFETAGDGMVTFASESGLSFSGEVSEASATVADFPASTNNVTLPLELGFEAEEWVGVRDQVADNVTPFGRATRKRRPFCKAENCSTEWILTSSR